MMGGRTALVIGYPALRGRYVLEAVARQEPDVTVIALVHPERLEEASEQLARLEPSIAARVSLRAGDPVAMDFGLSGAEYLELVERIDVVHAAYSIVDPGASADVCERVNVGAAREIVELGRASGRKPGVVWYSSVFVSGNRSGRVLETELQAGQGFRNRSERTLAIAELMLRKSGMPVAVLRAGHLIGDARTGEVEQLIGPYPLLVLLAGLPEEGSLPLPVGAEAPLPLTPVDHLAHLGAFVAARGLFGQTLHVILEAITLRRFLQLGAERLERRIDTRFNPTALTRALLGNPVAKLLPQNARGILEVLTTSAEYDTTHVQELVAAGAPVPALLEDYLGPLIDHVRARIQDGTVVTPRPALTPWLVA